MAEEFEIVSPSDEAKGARYDAECRSALKPAFEAMLDMAAKAGWERTRAAYELMYLASHTVAGNRESNKQ